MNVTQQGPGALVRAYVTWTLRHGRMLWLIALVLAAPALWRTVQLYTHLRSELEHLLPRKAPSVVAIDELRTRVQGLQYLGVVVDAKSAANLPAAERFLDDLTARIAKYPPELVGGVRTGEQQEREFLENRGTLYLELEDLKKIHERVEARRDWEVAKATGTDLDLSEQPPPVDFSDIEARYRNRFDSGNQKRKPREGGDPARFTDAERNLSLILIEKGGFDTGADRSRQLLEKVQADVAALGGPERYAPGMTLGYSGDVAIAVEELSALLADLSLSSIVVLALVIGSIVVYYRWWRSVLVLLPPLFLGAIYTFGLVSLPPLSITELNSNTAFLGSIIVGNGINFGLILLARYLEERRRGVSVEESLVQGVWAARSGTFVAALAAGVSYASLISTEFRGFRQFGYIGGLGMVLSWATCFLLVPPLIRWLDPGEIQGRSEGEDRHPILDTLTRWITRAPAAFAAFSLLLSALSIWQLRGLDASRIEYDLSKLRRGDTWEKGEGYWGRRMDAVLGRYLTPMVVLTDSPEDARKVASALRTAVTQEPLRDLIATVVTLDDVLPAKQEEKRAEAREIRAMLTPRMRSMLAPEERSRVERLLREESLAPIALDDIPATFTRALRERDGSSGKTVVIFPKPSGVFWQGPALRSFVMKLRSICDEAAPGGHARLAGGAPLSSDILASIERDGPRATLVAFLGVVAVVALLFRLNRTTIYVVGALCLGVLWMTGLVMALGVKINFANFIAFPITFGIGVDYAVNIMGRYTLDGRRDVVQAMRATGSAVALCSLTTIIGYGSLLMADNRALFLFGLVAVLGEIACLTAALTALPAALLLLDRKVDSQASGSLFGATEAHARVALAGVTSMSQR